MKGIVFTEFAEMVESKFSPEMLDEIIEASELPSGGAYTTVGTYDHREILKLVSGLSQYTGMPVSDLLRTFGQHLFGRFKVSFPHFFQDITSTYDFLESVERYIHIEVKKLYPDAELPSFECHRPDIRSLQMTYRSERALPDLAEGLIRGCIEHFGERVTLAREDLSENKGTCVCFFLTRQDIA